jgi:hypothetical protein
MNLECEIDIAENIVSVLTDTISKQETLHQVEGIKKAEQEVMMKMYQQCRDFHNRFMDLARDGLDDEKLYGTYIFMVIPKFLFTI